MLEIFQGGNAPISLEFDEDMEIKTNKLSASLHNQSIELKHWDKSDVILDGSVIILPILESDSLQFTNGKCKLSVKILDNDDDIIFYNEINARVIPKFDKTVMGEA